MGKLIGGLFIVLLMLLTAAPQRLSAQTFIDRLFYNSNNPEAGIKLKRSLRKKGFYCSEMDAYNKKRAYRKAKPSRFKRYSARRQPNPPEGSPIAERQPVKKTAPPAATKKPDNPPLNTPPKDGLPKKEVVNKTPNNPTPEKAPPVAKTDPEKASPREGVPTAPRRNDGELTRNSLKKMTKDQRRDTLLEMEPDLILTPLQFISDQDEFSVVNMDSFIQAMEFAQQGKVVLVEGHTDDLGSDAYNLSLSMKRAEKIRELLLSGGISDELISVIGYGESQPVVPNTSAENRSINRRIEFKIFSVSQ